MASNKVIRFGPVALTTTTSTNIINTSITSLAGPVGYTQTQPYVIVRHIRLVSKTTSSTTVSLFIGATGANAAGSEFLGSALPIAGNTAYDWYGLLRMDAADFMVGSCSAATSVTFEAEGEIGIS
jgi:hypothetical protein